MWLNAFFAWPLMMRRKTGDVEMTTGEVNDREAWKDWIFVSVGGLVLIAIICAVIFAR